MADDDTRLGDQGQKPEIYHLIYALHIYPSTHTYIRNWAMLIAPGRIGSAVIYS